MPNAQPDPEISLKQRRFLLLQGPSSLFFCHFGKALQSFGAKVYRVGFCPGDRLYWSKESGGYLPFREAPQFFPPWLEQTIDRLGVTDVVMLGDGRLYHAAAISSLLESQNDCNIWICEHGYLRPHLIAVEPKGMGGASLIPQRFEADICLQRPKPETRSFKTSFLRYAALDVMYHLANVIAAPMTYPHYQSHSGIHPMREYAGWVAKALRAPKRALKRRHALDQIAAHRGKLMLYTLQLSHDFQLRNYGTGELQRDTLRTVVTSFLQNAESDTLLVVKEHPLDNHLENWAHMVATLAPPDRVIFLAGGDLDALLERAAGVVTVNSTVGLMALQANVPTLALGAAIYKRDGLTSQSTLEEFWRAPVEPDPELVKRFTNYLRDQHHVPGTFDGPGAVVGARALAAWFGGETSYAQDARHA